MPWPSGRGRLVARGGELERQLPLVVVRQLLERPLADPSEDVRRRLLEGVADAMAVVEGRVPGTDVDWAGTLHGLHRLERNLTADEPLLVEVDDVVG